MTKVIVARSGPRAITQTFADGRVKVFRGDNTAEVQRSVVLAQDAASLAQHYANDDTNTDIPGGSSGERGAKYYALLSGTSQVASEAAAASALIYKTGAETAQDNAQADAVATAADRIAVAADKAQVANDKAYVTTTAANLVPYSPIAQTQLYDAGGSVNINGTGASLPNSDSNVAISPKTGAANEALYGADANNTRKAVAIGPFALQYFNGYDSSGIGWRALFYSVGRNSVAVGVHSGEATAYSGRDVNGFGVRASGTITFSSLPSDGDTITLNSVVFTARTSASTSTEFTIGGTISATIDNLLAKIVGSTSGSLRGYFFRKSTSGTVLEILAMGSGTWGNAFTLAVSGAGLARSGATLSGGTLLKNDGNQDNYTGLVAVGIGAVKRFDQVFGRAPYGTIFVTGQASVGATITLGLGLTVSTAAATVKRFVCVASGATGLQFNQGTDAASQIANIISALQAYVAANPTHTATNSVEFYASQRGIEIVHKTASNSGNLYRTETTGTGISAQSPYLHGGYSSANTPPIGIGMNSEGGFGANLVMVGKSAGRTAQGRGCIFLGENSGNTQIGEGNVYWQGSGQNVIGSNNYLLGASLGGATIQTYVYISSVSSTGLITLAAPLADAQCVIGRRMTFNQRNTVLSSNLIKQNGVNIANPTLQCVIVSPNQLQIIDYTDGTGPVGDAVYSTTGPATDIEIAPLYATLNFATSWGDAPESSTFHIGQNRQDRATVRSQRLEMPNGRWHVTALTAAAAHATGHIQFANANGNFAVDETVTINGTVFTAKAAGAHFVANTTSGSNSITVTGINVGTLAVGATVTGTGIPASTTITAIGSGPGGFGTVTLSANCTATNTGVAVTQTSSFTSGSTTMIRWFRIGLDMHESLQNLIACIRNSDDDSTSARNVRIATYWVAGLTGSGWRLHARITGRLSTGNNFTLASSKSGATVVAPTGGTVGLLPVAATVGNPAVTDGERRQITLGGQPADVIYSSSIDDYHVRYWGSA